MKSKFTIAILAAVLLGGNSFAFADSTQPKGVARRITR